MLSPKKKLPLAFALSLRDTGESTSTLVSPTSAAFANDSYHMCNFMISFPDPNNCPSLLNMGRRWGHYWVRWGDTFAAGFSLQRRKFHTLLFETWELSEHDLKNATSWSTWEKLFYIPQCQNLPKNQPITHQTYQNPSHLRLTWRHPAFSRIIDAATSVFGHLPRPSSPSGCGSGGARLPGGKKNFSQLGGEDGFHGEENHFKCYASSLEGTLYIYIYTYKCINHIYISKSQFSRLSSSQLLFCGCSILSAFSFLFWVCAVCLLVVWRGKGHWLE